MNMEKKLYSQPITDVIILGCPIMRAVEPSAVPDDSSFQPKQTKAF